jgi:hypothetical protein
MIQRAAIVALLSAFSFPAAAQVVELPAPTWSAPAFEATGIDVQPALSQLETLSPLGQEIAPLRLEGLSAAPIGPDGTSAVPSGIESEALELWRRLGSPKIVEKKTKIAPERMPGDGELSGDVRGMPAFNSERMQRVKAIFEGEGAAVREQDIGAGQKNLIVEKPGKSKRRIVIGGHYDKVDVGQGTIDNATGVMMVAQLFRLLKDLPTEHTIVFIAFGREEEGLVGSEKYVDSLSREDRGLVDAMINLDTLGVDGTFSWKNNSDRALLDAIQLVARRDQFNLTEQRLWGGDADSTSFRRAGIKAMTVFGASPDVIFEIIHSERDNFSSFSLDHYKNAFLLTGALIRYLDAPPGGS